MLKFIRLFLTAIVLCSTLSLSAAAIDDVKTLYNEGNYEGAIEKLRPMLKKTPRDGTVNYYMGAALYALGQEQEAVPYLEKSESRGVGVASELLADIAMSHYNVSGAEKHLSIWSANLKKAKKSAPESYDNLSSRLVTLRNMLDRVERIEVIDSIDVDSATFFDYYRLSQSAGRLVPPGAVASLVQSKVAPFSPAYMPESRNEIFWSGQTQDGYQLMGAGILDDGTLDHPAKLFDNADGNTAFPYLMNDGMTLYFASDGEGSIGGYDIFMTRRNDEGTFYQPQNIGMPYNTPDNDFMLAIDEASGLGWWATDRNHVPGKVTIYIYIPSEVRSNVDSDNPQLESLAKLSNIALTQTPGKDYKTLLESKLPKNQGDNGTSSGSRRFAIDMGNGKIYHNIEDFKKPEARSTMLEAMAAEVELRKVRQQLDNLRERYRKGDRSVAANIIDAEQQVEDLQKRVGSLRNKAIRLELAKN